MKKTLRDRIAALAAMNLPALRREHRKVFAKEPVSAFRKFLLYRITSRKDAVEVCDPQFLDGIYSAALRRWSNSAVVYHSTPAASKSLSFDHKGHPRCIASARISMSSGSRFPIFPRARGKAS
jgi:hypothetical protein